MAVSYSIPLFPADVDRESFGHWVSGFVDGEGSFDLKLGCGKYPKASFSISLRADDCDALVMICAYWGVGCVYPGKARRVVYPNGREGVINPQALYKVAAAADLAGVLVPHFNRYPLRAKKARDFVIWSRAVELIAQVVIRKRRAIVGADPRPGRPKGTLPKWSNEERAEFTGLQKELRAVHTFALPSLTPILRD